MPDEPAKFYNTIGMLRETLASYPDDWVVVMSRDAEGNGYSPLSGISDDLHYAPDSTWSGEVVDPIEDGPRPDAVPALVLWPIN